MTALALPPAHVPARRSPGFVADRAMQLAERTFEIEARALLGMGMGMGMGKSGHVGRKIAATPASTGPPAFFVHPDEASHVDLCMPMSGDVVLAISHRASITAQAAPGDALAVALLDARGSRDDDFARSHPGGSLGRKLLERVRDVMEQHRVTSRLVVDAQGVRLGALNSNNLMRAKVI